MKQSAPKTPVAVLEQDDAFLKLWPHRYDYLFAAHPKPGQKPAWQTESRHLLSDRLINQGAYLYGVRFGPTTNYLLLDIDRGSPYHPEQNPHAFDRVKEALEPLSLVDCITCSSSDSGGLHLYFPFNEAQKSWEIGLVAATLLENRGLMVSPGTLEVFPNPKAFCGDELTLYNGHRLPLQGLSMLLNRSLEPVFGNRDRFAAIWQKVITKNTLDTDTLRQTLKIAHRRNYRVSGKAQKFLNDLHAEIEPGWTGHGQTNHLIGRITMRAYIFGHLLSAPAPLKGEELVRNIVKTAQSLPGFNEWCRHKDELEKKAKEWARSIEKSHYYPYGTKAKSQDKEAPSWNEQQSKSARERICSAIATLLEEEKLPSQTRQRFTVLTERFHIGGSTLYRHRDLWHPAHLEETPPDSLDSITAAGDSALWGRITPAQPTSLLGGDGSNTPLDKGLDKAVGQGSEGAGGNTFSPRDLADKLAMEKAAKVVEVRQAQAAAERVRQQQAKARQRQRIESFLTSGDPILIKEAISVIGGQSPRWMEQGVLPLDGVGDSPPG